jgi:putative transposase
MMANGRLARAIGDVGFGEFRRQIEYKAAAQGVRVVIADRWFPSSKTCADCGFVVDILPLSVREWACPECGVVHDRDVNAAINLEKLGRATPEETPVERKALARPKGRVKSASRKQEMDGAHISASEG